MDGTLSQKKLEEYSSNINKLLKDAKYDLVIPTNKVYDEKVLSKICKSWEQAQSKIKDAEKIIRKLLRGICADLI